MAALRRLHAHAPETFVCDVCGKIIENPEAGYVVWDADDQMLAYGIKVIHHAKCDDRSCGRSNDLPHFLGEDGLAYLLSFLSAGPIAMKEKFGAGKGGSRIWTSSRTSSGAARRHITRKYGSISTILWLLIGCPTTTSIRRT